jgi:hypothetical protein
MHFALFDASAITVLRVEAFFLTPFFAFALACRIFGEQPEWSSIVQSVSAIVAITIPIGVAFYWYRYSEEGLLLALGEFLRCDSWPRVGSSLGVGLLAAIWILPLLMETEFLESTVIYAVFAVSWFATIVGVVLMVQVLGDAYFPASPELAAQARWV